MRRFGAERADDVAEDGTLTGRCSLALTPDRDRVHEGGTFIWRT